MIGALQTASASRRPGPLALAALLAILLAGLPAAPAQALMLGIHAERDGDGLLSEAEVLRMRQAGTRTLRVPFEWEVVQRDQDGPLDFDRYDKLMTWASEGTLPRVRILPTLLGSPGFVEKSEFNAQPPVTVADLERWRVFVASAVARYGRTGTFWTQTSGVQFNPMVDWQVWNEPNLRTFWTHGKPRPTEYAAFLDLTNQAIKSVDPAARTVLAGMPQSRITPRPMTTFLTKLYKVPGFRHDFDVIAVHTYIPLEDRTGLEEAVGQVRAVADENGDEAKTIYVTELGAASAGPVSPFTTDQKGQRKALVRLFGSVREFASRLKVRRAYWYSWRDGDFTPPGFPSNDRWQTYAGLFKKNGVPKSAWSAFAQLNGGDPGTDPLP
ncbi:MAG: polysaccharide biosynthesis protein PslG [Thermoleophilaceae bacterium]|nr:polysaccharide biosynthesis protein PslG [Thermoleophilaceae bacterium]